VQSADTTAIKKDEINPMNMRPTEEKHRFGKGDSW